MGKRILLAEDDPTLREFLSETLREEGLEVDAVGTGTEAVEKAAKRTYDLMLLDLQLPGLNGMEVAGAARGDKEETPLLFITGLATAATYQNVEALDRAVLIEKPIDMERLRSSIDRLLYEQPSPGRKRNRRALIVEDHPATRALLLAEMTELGYDVSAARTGEEAVEKARRAESPFELALVDWNLPGRDGGWVIRELQKQDRAIAPVAVSGEAGRGVIQEAYRAGAYNFLRKPFDLSKMEFFLSSLDEEAERRRKEKSREERQRQLPWWKKAASWLRCNIFCSPSANARKKLALISFVVVMGFVGALLIEGLAPASEWFSEKTDRMETFIEKVEGYLERDEERELRESSKSPLIVLPPARSEPTR